MTTITDYLTSLDAPRDEVGGKLRAVIDAALPEATGAMWHGHPTWNPGARQLASVKLRQAYALENQ